MATLSATSPATSTVPFVRDLARHAGRVALVAGGRRVTYAELAQRVERRAADLGPGRRLVMIAGANHPEVLVAYLAALHAGHVAWLVPDIMAARDLMAGFDPDVVVAADGAGVAIEHRTDAPGHVLHPELALLLGTSGSTGAPRLVRLSHTNLQANAASIATYLGIAPGERAATSLPLHYCYGLSVAHSHLLAGATLLLSDHSVADAGFWELMRAEDGTSFAGVPHTFELLERAGFAAMDVPSLRYVTQAGGRMAPERVRRFAALGARRGWELVVMYGQTEATARMAYLPAALAAEHPGTIGIPIPGGAFTLRPHADAPEPGVGELMYRGPNVMLGYAETAADLARPRDVEELATGDLARRTAGGLYEIVGRRSRFLKLFGLRVDLGQVERLLAQAGMPAVCAGDDERLAVAVTGDTAPEDALAVVTERLGLPAAAVGVRHHREVPRLANGKPDYRAIAAATAVPAGSSTAAEGRGWTRRRARGLSVAGIFAAALGRASVGPDDTFTGLGGDSLTYVEVSLGLEDALGHLPEGWPDMTVARLQARAAPPRGRPRPFARVEMGVALRAAAILLVLASHMTDLFPAGGAHLLLAMAGYNFARFTLTNTDAPDRLRRALGTVARIAVPSSLWITAVVMLAGGYSLGTVLLVNDYTGSPELGGDGRWHYWFIEALVQILLVLAIVFCVPAVRRAERRRPFWFALALLAGALVFRFDVITLGDPTRYIFRPHTVVWLFLLGWVACRATTTAQRLAVSALVLACVPGFFGETPREMVIAGGLLLLLWVRTVPVPRFTAGAISLIAGASLYIYLTHWQVWPNLPGGWPVPAAMAACVVTGIAVWAAAGRVTASAAHVRAVLARRPGGARDDIGVATR